MPKKGLFIVFEGIDGAGTGTAQHKLNEWMIEENKYAHILLAHEPWKSKEIKHMLKNDKDAYTGAEELAQLYVSDRVDHIKQLIGPVLCAGEIVSLDRFKMSTCAYQQSQGMELDKLMRMHEEQVQIVPDITLVFNVDPKTAMLRINAGRGSTEKFENVAFLKQANHAYQDLAQKVHSEERRYHGVFGDVKLIDANQTIPHVTTQVIEAVKPYFDKWNSQ